MNVRLAISAMGTRFEAVLTGDDFRHLRAAGEAALAEIEELDRRLSAFRADSVISRVNRMAPAGPVLVDDDTADLLRLCLRLRADTGGAFDACVGHLMRAWGFRDGKPAATPEDATPGRFQIEPHGRAVRFTHPATALDLGGIAKGWALDAAAAILREAGVETAFLHGGTSAAIAIGSPPGLPGWAVRIRSGDLRGPVVHLADAAMSVSAPAGRMIHVGGRLVGHVIDPRTGHPTNALPAAAVITRSAADADAWATALLVLGHRPAHLGRDVTTVLPAGAAWSIAGGRAGSITGIPARQAQEALP